MTERDSYRRIGLDLMQRVARLTIRRPPLNVLDIPTLQEMALALDTVERAEHPPWFWTETDTRHFAPGST